MMLQVLCLLNLPLQAATTPSGLPIEERFRKNCMTCHAPPDPRFHVDRAWLGQVHDTA